MQNQDIFIIVLIVILVLFYLAKMCETYVSGSFDITRDITVAQDWKGATLSAIPYFTNNLETPPPDVMSQIKQLQTYQKEQDGPTDSNWVASNGNYRITPDIDSPDNREGFTLMNPYINN
jgi:hypothetical protein